MSKRVGATLFISQTMLAYLFRFKIPNKKKNPKKLCHNSLSEDITLFVIVLPHSDMRIKVLFWISFFFSKKKVFYPMIYYEFIYK